jgi:RNA polymerase sigma factor for flagellar operon FliA
MHVLDDFELGKTWKLFWSARSAETPDARRFKERLVLHYHVRLSAVIQRAKALVPPYISGDDVTQEVLLAIGRAVDRFDPGRGFQFESYAADLVRASVQEYLRREDWVPRSVRKRQQQVRAVYDRLERSQPAPTDVDRAAALGMSLDAFYDAERRSPVYEVCSLDNIALTDGCQVSGDGYDAAMELPALVTADTPPHESAEKEVRCEVIRQLVSKLPTRLKALIEMRYYQGMTLQEVANRMRLSQSRIAQLERDAMTVIRRKMLASRQVALFTDQEA